MSWTKFELLEDADYTAEGLKFFRMDVSKVESGAAQIKHNLSDVNSETIFRLSMKARSPSKSTFKVGIRVNGPPYNWLWSQNFSPTPNWSDYAWDFIVKPPKGVASQPVCFMILSMYNGIFDIASFELQKATKEELISNYAAKYALFGTANLLSCTRFPLGLQQGWSIDRELCDLEDVKVETDDSVIGPSGSPALKLFPRKDGIKVILRSPPFPVPLSFEPHTASVFAKGDGLIKISVRHADRKNNGQCLSVQEFAISPDNDWKRYELAFNPQLLGKYHYLEIEGAGQIWIDALQVEHGTKATEYKSEQYTEIALKLPDSATSNANIQFEDEKPELLFCVSGKAFGGILKTKVFDAYDQFVELPDITLGDSSFLNKGAVDFSKALKERKYGPFRIECHVEHEGKKISPISEIVIYRLRKPRYWGKDAPSSPFGVHTNPTDRHMKMAKAIGINWVRLHDAGLGYVGWAFLEPEKGKWNFKDEKILAYRKNNLKISAELGTSPKWASRWDQYNKKQFTYHDWFAQPKDFNEYGEYVKTVVERYKNEIDTWFIWNEPYWESAWSVAFDKANPKARKGYLTSENPAADFARLMKHGYTAAKEANPSVIVVGGCTRHTAEGGENGREWTKGLFENGYLDYCDILEYHQYISGQNLFPGDKVEKGLVGAFSPVSDKLGKIPKPVWMSEGSSIRDIIANGMYKNLLISSETEDFRRTSDDLCRYVISLLANNVAKIFLYSMYGIGAVSGQDPSSWRVLVTSEGALHPSGAAFSTMAYLLEDKNFKQMREVAEKVYEYTFADKHGDEVKVLSPAQGHAEFAIPENLTALDIFGNPIHSGSKIGNEIVYVTSSEQ